MTGKHLASGSREMKCSVGCCCCCCSHILFFFYFLEALCVHHAVSVVLCSESLTKYFEHFKTTVFPIMYGIDFNEGQNMIRVLPSVLRRRSVYWQRETGEGLRM